MIPSGQRSEEEEVEDRKMVASSNLPAHVTTRSQLVTLLEMVEAKYVEAQEAWTDVEALKVDQAKYDEAVVVAETVKDMAVQLMKNYHSRKEIEISGQFNRLCCSCILCGMGWMLS